MPVWPRSNQSGPQPFSRDALHPAGHGDAHLGCWLSPAHSGLVPGSRIPVGVRRPYIDSWPTLSSSGWPRGAALALCSSSYGAMSSGDSIIAVQSQRLTRLTPLVDLKEAPEILARLNAVRAAQTDQ